MTLRRLRKNIINYIADKLRCFVIFEDAADLCDYDVYISAHSHNIICMEIIIKYLDDVNEYNNVLYNKYYDIINEHIEWIHHNVYATTKLRKYIQSTLLDANDIRNKYDLYNEVIRFIEQEKNHVSGEHCCTLEQCAYKKWYLNHEIDYHKLRFIVDEYYKEFINDHKDLKLSLRDKIVIKLRSLYKVKNEVSQLKNQL